MSKVKLGNHIEKLVREKLEADGWLVEKARRQKFQSQDLFGLFDIIAVRKFQIKFIQISANPLSKRGKHYGAKLEEFPAINKEYWWCRYDGTKKNFKYEDMTVTVTRI